MDYSHGAACHHWRFNCGAAEQAKWIAGAVQAWKGAKGTYDAGLARKALEEQGLTEFLAKLDKAGAL